MRRIVRHSSGSLRVVAVKIDRVDISGNQSAADEGRVPRGEVSDTVSQPSANATMTGLDYVIDQLVTGLTQAIEHASHPAASRATAFQVLSGWLRTNRHRLSNPAKADSAEELIRSALHPSETGSTPLAPVVDLAAATKAAQQLAATLGDDFPMAIVWVAAGLDAQLD